MKTERQPSATSPDEGSPIFMSRIVRYGPAVLLVLLVVGFMINESLWAAIIILADGTVAAIVWLAAIWLGWRAITLLGLPDTPLRWQIVLSAGVGIGLLALLVLLLGLLGILHRAVWVMILAAMVVAFAARARVYVRQARARAATGRWIAWRVGHLLWLPALAFLPIVLLVATIPPGLSWPTEAGGYDVLEYHFGGPKEYWLAGRILPLPHNVYTYFPFNAEMLYLLAFVLKGGPFNGVYLAQLLNASLAIWTVAAAWLAGRELGRMEGIIAGVLTATCPWLTYLSGVAFVENGLLFLCMLTLAVIVRVWMNPSCRQGSWFALAGVLAGLACGFKYTAAPMLALPIGLIVVWLAWIARPRRRLGPVLFAAGLIITFGPWLAKNAWSAGNPVFPLAHRAFGYRSDLWTDTLAARWDAAHAPQPDEADLNGRLRRLWQRVLSERSYGPALFLAALLGAPAIIVLSRGPRRGLALSCLVVLCVQTITWLMATHLYARFGVPIIAPLVVLAAGGWSCLSGVRAGAVHRIMMIVVVVGGTAINLVYVGGLYYDHTRDRDGRRRGWFGAALAIVQIELANRHTPEQGTTVWLVGEGRAFYVARPCFYHVVFSRDPLADFAQTQPTGRQLIDWFRRRGVTHVCINWSEINRFRQPGNYGWHDAVDEPLFAKMRSAGAAVTHAERDRRTGQVIYEILEVPAP